MAVAVLSTGLALGCARILGFGDVPAPVDAGADATEGPSGDGSSEAAADGGSCALFHAPPPPPSDDPSDAGDQSFVVAIHTVDFGLDTDGGPPPLLGYDLDDVDTCCQGAPESCKAAVAGNPHCDEEGGRDNQGGELLASVEQVSPNFLDQDLINQRFGSGKESLLLQVLHYNGQPNDSDVTVAVYGSGGVEPGADGGAVAPLWNGTDVWMVDSRFVVGASGDAGPLVPNHFAPHAYVSNGVLVATLALPLPFQANGSYLQMTDALGTARVEPVLGSFRLADGRIAGRWTASSILAWVQTFSSPFGGGYICKGTSDYMSVKQTICQSLDVVSDSTQDGKGATCDALSMGLGFVADPVLLGRVSPPPTVLPTCPDAGPDDCTMP